MSEIGKLRLTRKLYEFVVIDDEIKITVIELSKARVRLEIEAPKTKRILRGELCEDLSTQQ